jgi:hypothetical protein
MRIITADGGAISVRNGFGGKKVAGVNPRRRCGLGLEPASGAFARGCGHDGALGEARPCRSPLLQSRLAGGIRPGAERLRRCHALGRSLGAAGKPPAPLISIMLVPENECLSATEESNLKPPDYKSSALPIELVMGQRRRIRTSDLRERRSSTELYTGSQTRNAIPQSGARQPGLNEPGHKAIAWVSLGEERHFANPRDWRLTRTATLRPRRPPTAPSTATSRPRQTSMCRPSHPCGTNGPSSPRHS